MSRRLTPTVRAYLSRKSTCADRCRSVGGRGRGRGRWLRCGARRRTPCRWVALQDRFRSERGNAPVEFIGWVLVLVVPALYLLVTLSQVQAASFAVASGADAAARIMSVEEGDVALSHARAAVALALGDQGVEADPTTAMTVSCAARGCEEGAVVRVEAGVDLPVLAAVGLGRDVVVLNATRTVTFSETAR